MTHDELIISRIEDKVRQCRDGYYVTATGLLDSHEQALARQVMRHAGDVRTFLYGGYRDAERRMLVCVPADIPMSEEEAAGIIALSPSDDVVEIRRPNSESLYGRAPSITQYLIELRGIGIIDVKSLYGVEAVKDEQRIDLVIKLEDWTKEKEYDRLGMTDEYMNILGIDVTCHSLPIRPGRNLAIICETAAVNHRQKKMGYNAARELLNRLGMESDPKEVVRDYEAF